MTVKMFVLILLAVIALIFTMFAALIMQIRSIKHMIEDMPWELASASDMLREDAAEWKPPDGRKPQALADDEYKTPLARIASERLRRQRNEAAK